MVKIAVGHFSSFIFCLFVLFHGLFFLFDYALYHCLPELGCELVNTGFRVDGEAVINFQKFVGGVLVGLCECDIGDGVDNIDVTIK